MVFSKRFRKTSKQSGGVPAKSKKNSTVKKTHISPVKKISPIEEAALSVKECPICYNDIIDGGFKTNCDHVFHKQCIEKWLNGHTTCPTCRTHVTNFTRPPPPKNNYRYQITFHNTIKDKPVKLIDISKEIKEKIIAAMISAIKTEKDDAAFKKQGLEIAKILSPNNFDFKISGKNISDEINSFSHDRAADWDNGYILVNKTAGHYEQVAFLKLLSKYFGKGEEKIISFPEIPGKKITIIRENNEETYRTQGHGYGYISDTDDDE